jgi:hypothetical protein
MGRSTYGFGLTWSALCAAALIACGGGQPPATTPAEPGAAPAAEGGEDLVWSDTMSDKKKAEFMKQKVMPAMSKTFKAFDAKEYDDFSCKTCHGKDFKPHPVDALPELHVKDGKLVEAAEHGKMAQFMGEKVSPQMAEIFGKKPFDPATGEGFGCGGCHKMNH